MRLAVADTTPLHYLVLIGEIDMVGALVDQVLIPPEVRDELDSQRTPAPVRAWIAAPPAWLRMQTIPAANVDPELARLDPGERAAIALAMTVGANALLVDDRAGVAAARARGVQAFGTLGLLQRAARRGLLDLPRAIARLAATNFHVRQELLDMLLDEVKAGR